MRIALALFLAVVTAQAQLPFARAKSSDDSSDATSERSATSLLSAPPASLPMPSNFRGSVPRGEAMPGALDLSLAEAVHFGLERNLGTLLTTNGERTARGERLIALSRLLPHVHAEVNETSQQINIAAFGFPPSPVIPGLIGPFKVFDSRAYVSQTLFNLRQIYEKRASERQVEAAVLDSGDARATVIEVVTALYWEAVSGASRVTAAQAEVNTAQATYQQAEDRRSAGLVPAIDVLRAQVELQAEQQRLIASRAAFEKQKLNLAQAIGVPSNQVLTLTDTLAFDPLTQPPSESDIQQAYLARSDYKSQRARVQAAELQKKGADRVRIPSLSVDTDYGLLGRSPSSSHGTYSVKLGLNIPIFAGRAEEGALMLADAEVSRQQTLLDELKSQITFEIRSVVLDLNSAAEQVAVSRSSMDLATQQVTQARDRFQAGVTDTLEVVQAQQGLAAANESYITSLYAYTLAKVQLARAMGQIEEPVAGQPGKTQKP